MLFADLSMKTLLLGAIAVEAFLVYFPYVGVAIGRVTNDYDMSAPRAMIDRLPDWVKRANWAHENAWEAFAIFTATALMVYISGLDTETARYQLLGHIAARVLFPIFYILDIPILRSMSFVIGSVCAFSLMLSSISASLI